MDNKVRCALVWYKSVYLMHLVCYATEMVKQSDLWTHLMQNCMIVLLRYNFILLVSISEVSQSISQLFTARTLSLGIFRNHFMFDTEK